MVNAEIRKKLDEDAIVFDNPSFDNSIIGTTFDGRPIYVFAKMVEELSTEDGIEDWEAMDFISYDTMRSLQYQSGKTPIVVSVEE